MKRAIQINIDQARAFAIRRQLLGAGKAGAAGVMEAMQRLGYVQIDTINVVERAHHHTLWSRVPGYQPELLDGLQRRSKLFEYLAHAMCYLPMTDYRYYRRHMEEFAKKGKWYKYYYKKYGKLAEAVLKRIEKEGPLTTGDFEDTKGRKRGTWWDWKPAKVALEMLFYRGELMVSERRRFQRVYDLRDRVLPKGGGVTIPPEGEEKRFFARRALGALGLATEQDVNRYITIGGKLGQQLSGMEKTGEAVRIEICGLSKPYFTLAENVDELGKKGDDIQKAFLLSPFDNLIILRDRTKALFGMDYALECYTPAAKRKFGYFSIPILWENALAGRLDPKADRETGALLVRSLHLERPMAGDFFRELAAELGRFAEFNGCSNVNLAGKKNDRLKQLAKYI